MTDATVEINETVRVLARPILAAKPKDPIWVGSCCGRLTVVCAAEPPKVCGKCGKPASVREITQEDL